MPCKKCDEGYKWGDNGECEYPDKESCENANSKYKKEKKEYSSEAPSPLNYKSFDDYKKAYNEWSLLQETKLAKSVKVELGLAQDLEKMGDKAYNLISRFEEVMSDSKESLDAYEDAKGDIEVALDMADNVMQEIRNIDNNLSSMLNEFDEVADSIGIKATDSEDYNYAYDAQAELELAEESLDTVMGRLDKAL